MKVLKKPACLPVIDMTCILDLTQSIGYTTSQRQAPPKPPLNTIGATPAKHRHPKLLKLSKQIKRIYNIKNNNSSNKVSLYYIHLLPKAWRLKTHFKLQALALLHENLLSIFNL